MKYEIYDFLRIHFGRPLFKLFRLRLYDKRKIDSCVNSYNLLKSLVDIHSLKPATGELREMQLKNYNFTKEIISELEQNGIQPFMMYGTILGAERHKGYIPWDDDIDFGVIREDYKKILEYSKQNFVVCYQNINRYKWGKSAKKTIKKALSEHPNKTILLIYPFLYKFIKGTSLSDMVQMDLFACDYYKNDYRFEEYKNYSAKLQSKLWKINNTQKEVEYLEKERINNPNVIEDSEKVCFGIDNIGFYTPFMNKIGFWNKDDVFPLKRMKFEETEFWAPNNHIKILEYIYGDWESLPNKIESPHASERE